MIRSRRCPFPVRPRFDTRQWPPPAFPSPSSFLHDRPGSLPGKQFDGYPSFAAIHGTAPEPTRVVVIRRSHFNALAGLHLDRVPILSFIFPMNARLCVRVCHGDNSDSFSLPRRRHPCKSLSRRNKVLLTRASEERARAHPSASAARTCASRLWFLPSQNRTSIRCLGPLRAVTED